MSSTQTSRIDAALAFLRIVIGVVFIAHAYQKFFIYGLPGVTAGFTQYGIPAPGIMAPVIALSELAGGIALVAGFLTPVAAAGLALIMLGAIVKVHLQNGFFAPTGFELPFALLAVLATLALTGAGQYSLDAVRARRRSV